MNFKKKILTFCFLSISLLSLGQINKNYSSVIVKTVIFLNLPFNQVKEENLDKFIKSEIQIQTIKSYGFISSVIFLKVDSLYKYIGKENISDGNCEIPYIVAVDTLDQTYFRLQGFYQNDFLALRKKLSYAKLKDCKIDNLDLRCIYKGLSNAKIDYEKFPCLRFCGQVASIR